MQGVRVLGDTSRLAEIAARSGWTKPSSPSPTRLPRTSAGSMEACEGAKIKVRIVPGLFELFDDERQDHEDPGHQHRRRPGPERRPVREPPPEIAGHYRDKRIMVTGAGGSIGSELCRQLAGLKPRRARHARQRREQHLRDRLPRCARSSPSVKVDPGHRRHPEPVRLEPVFERYRPEIIFHAAAHKHVPLMEANIAEAISNNVVGTKIRRRTGRPSTASRVSSSSRPTRPSTRRASWAPRRRSARSSIQELAAASATRFSCVRFGNVLGSRGSVVPLFQKQIAQGGPRDHHPSRRCGATSCPSPRPSS